jgi:hypothetical protein
MSFLISGGGGISGPAAGIAGPSIGQVVFYTIVSALPPAASVPGFRGYVTDSTLALGPPSIGDVVVGGSNKIVPVFSDGTNWILG